MKVLFKFACYDSVDGRTMTNYRVIEDTDEYSHVCYRIQFYMHHCRHWANEYQQFIHWSTLESLMKSEQFRMLFGRL